MRSPGNRVQQAAAAQAKSKSREAGAGRETERKPKGSSGKAARLTSSYRRTELSGQPPFSSQVSTSSGSDMQLCILFTFMTVAQPGVQQVPRLNARAVNN